VFRQDPRYLELGEGGVWQRAGYALSRTVLTHGAAWATQFNVSELGGNALAASISNAYYPPASASERQQVHKTYFL
jgi:hypothetical protein